MFRSYLKTTLRNLVRNKIYSAINIAGLSLGLACAMLIILYTKDELSFDRFHKNSDHIFRVVHTRVGPDGGVVNKGGNSGAFQGPKFTAMVPELLSYVRVNSEQQEIKLGNEIVNREVHVADSNFLSVFTFPLIKGNPVTALQNPNSVVISESAAKEQFGSSDVIGKTIQIKNDEKFEPFIVTGVAKNSPQNSSLRFNILRKIKISDGDMNWGNFFMTTFVVVKPTANIKQTEKKINAAFQTDAQAEIARWAKEYGDKNKLVFSLQPYTDIHLSKDYKASNGLTDGSDTIYSYILSGIAIFILLIACINFVNLTVARSIKRSKEIGIRKVVGGERRQLIMQFLGESFTLCFFAFLLAILIVQLILPTFNQLASKALYLSYLFDVKLVAGYIALFFITGLLAGFYPALVLSNYNPVQTLYNRFTVRGKSYLQRGLVILQFSLATLLVIATITIYSQFNYLTNKPLGYDDKNVVLIEKWGIKISEAEVFKSELLKNPDIIGVAAKNGGRRGTMAKINGETQIGFDYETVDENYLPLFKIPIAQGRNFSSAFPSDSSHSILVNEAFVRIAGWKNPIGQTVNFWYKNNETYTVVGVVKDYHFLPLAKEIGPQLFTLKAPGNQYGLILAKIKPNTAASSLKYIQKKFREFFPLSSYSYKFKDLENLKNYEAEAKWKQMMLFGAIITIFISCIGLFGLSVLSAEKRTKEIGIRKVLGASVGRVVTLLSTDFLRLVIMAMLIAMPVAWLLANKWLQNYPYRITLNWTMFAGAGMLVVLVALTTVSFQAIKAAIANPAKSLRSE